MSLVADYADALGIEEEEASLELADAGFGGGRIPRTCPTCGWDDAEHLPGEFGANCPYGD